MVVTIWQKWKELVIELEIKHGGKKIRKGNLPLNEIGTNLLRRQVKS